MSNSTTLHEQSKMLSADTINKYRAIASLMEELEAVDWYAQRVEATDNGELRQIFAHDRDAEIEHAAMGIEWLRRNDATFERPLKTYLFTDRPIAELEAQDTGTVSGSNDAGSSLSIRSLRAEVQ